MTELSLYKFIVCNEIEWHKRQNEGKEDVIAFVNYCNLEDFIKTFGPYQLSDCEVNCVLKETYVAIWISQICDYHAIEMGNVFIEE